MYGILKPRKQFKDHAIVKQLELMMLEAAQKDPTILDRVANNTIGLDRKPHTSSAKCDKAKREARERGAFCDDRR